MLRRRLSKLGEDVTETLEVVPRQWKVVQTVRERFSCRSCETITQPPAPFHPIARGRAGPNLLATILEAKFGQHLPLNRQSETYAREGIELSVSTLADWVGACTATLAPLTELIRAHVMAAERLHGDDTTVPVLARGKTITGRLWTYVRDDRPFAGPAPPAAVFLYSRDRTAGHPDRHLAGYAGMLQADAYAGFNELYEAGAQAGPDRRSGVLGAWPAQVLRLGELAKAPLALEAVRRIDAIFDVERGINGLPAEQRLAIRQQHVAPLVTELEDWMRAARGKLSRHADAAKAMDLHEGTPRQACSGGHQQRPQGWGVRFKPLTDAARPHQLTSGRRERPGGPTSLLLGARLEETGPHYMTARTPFHCSVRRPHTRRS